MAADFACFKRSRTGGRYLPNTHEPFGNPLQRMTDVVVYLIAGQGHAWPGGILPRPGADPPSTEISATDEMWAFFAAHPKP